MKGVGMEMVRHSRAPRPDEDAPGDELRSQDDGKCRLIGKRGELSIDRRPELDQKTDAGLHQKGRTQMKQIEGGIGAA
jgi:hypothetical protein